MCPSNLQCGWHLINCYLMHALNFGCTVKIEVWTGFVVCKFYLPLEQCNLFMPHAYLLDFKSTVKIEVWTGLVVCPGFVCKLLSIVNH